ncbi:MAG: type IV pilus modification PilV family protein [Planctomycetota bacterium]
MGTDMRTDARRGRPGAARGFTLIEILMAMMVLSIGLASVLSVFIVGLRSSRRVVDESAAAVAAKAMLARVLSEDILPPSGGAGDPDGDGVRDYLELIATARGGAEDPACDWVWIHDKGAMTAGNIGQAEDDGVVPEPKPIADNSRFSWRCRASRFRSLPANPRKDLVDAAGNGVSLKEGRVPASQDRNPDSDEMWRIMIEVYRDYVPGRKPLASFETYVCMAHR